MALLSRILQPGAPRRPRSMVEAFRLAEKYRREGRYAEAVEMVAYGLALDPNNLTGHLLSAYLHSASRAMARAKAEFGWVLERDPNHARALLGLARIALEEGDVGACRACLRKALRAYPDFPEAQALLDALGSGALASTPPPRTAAHGLDRLRMPANARALVLARGDGAVIAARPPEARDDEASGHAARTLAMAGAALARSGFGTLRRAIVEDQSESVFVRTDGQVVLALVLPRTTELTQGLLEVNRLWAGAQHELGLVADAARSADAGPRRPR